MLVLFVFFPPDLTQTFTEMESRYYYDVILNFLLLSSKILIGKYLDFMSAILLWLQTAEGS